MFSYCRFPGHTREYMRLNTDTGPGHTREYMRLNTDDGHEGQTIIYMGIVLYCIVNQDILITKYQH